MDWLNTNFDISGLRIKALACYGGDVRIYTGNYDEFLNQKSSFRKEYTNGNKIYGTRGRHKTKIAEYVAINKDEFEEIKDAWEHQNSDEFEFYNDIIFNKLERNQNKWT